MKTLVFVDGDGEPVAFLVSGANRLDPVKGAAAAGPAELRKPDARATKEWTGFSIGGIPPFGHERHDPDFTSTRISLAIDEVWAAAGLPDASFPLAPDDLRLPARRPQI